MAKRTLRIYRRVAMSIEMTYAGDGKFACPLVGGTNIPAMLSRYTVSVEDVTISDQRQMRASGLGECPGEPRMRREMRNSICWRGTRVQRFPEIAD